jgi:RES domain
VIFYRVFDWDGRSLGAELGGPLFVPRKMQGAGRFDIPELDGVLYASAGELGAVAETLQGFRSRTITNRHFERPDGRRKAIVAFEIATHVKLVDLDDAQTLARLTLAPSQVMTHHRVVTHPIVQRLYHERADGLLWPSAIEGSWKNACLFDSRIQSKLRLSSEIQPLTIKHPIVQKAAAWLNLPLIARPTVRRK